MNKIIILFILITFTLFSKELLDPYIGYWLLPNQKVIVEIQKKENEYVGYIRWLKDSKYPIGDKMAGKEQIDRNNPSPLLRNRKVLNLQVVGGLVKNEKNQLVKGWIYDSWNGKFYYGSITTLNTNTLKLKGSIDKFGILSHSLKIKKVNLERYIDYSNNKNNKD